MDRISSETLRGGTTSPETVLAPLLRKNDTVTIAQPRSSPPAPPATEEA